jgi:bacterioferritin-associated ferredoxin
MIVCVCHRVSDRDIRRHVEAGCESFEALQFATGAATCCGCCDTCARSTFADAHAEKATRQASATSLAVASDACA